jgi:uncharacterized protein YjiS (DUF1127 family)
MTVTIGNTIRKIGREMRARRAMRQLHELDDRTLADLGLTRGDIEAAARGRWPARGKGY